LGRNKKTAMIQFLKSKNSGEIEILKKLGIEVKQFGTEKFYDPLEPDEKTQEIIKEGWNYAKKLLSSDLDILVLDELNVALGFNLLDTNEVIQTIKNKNKNLTLIITGRNAPKELIAIADVVTEMFKIKHDFDYGREAEEGVEF